MKDLSILELKAVNGGCQTCYNAGKAAKKAWNHVKDAATGFWDGVFGD